METTTKTDSPGDSLDFGAVTGVAEIKENQHKDNFNHAQKGYSKEQIPRVEEVAEMETVDRGDCPGNDLVTGAVTDDAVMEADQFESVSPLQSVEDINNAQNEESKEKILDGGDVQQKTMIGETDSQGNDEAIRAVTRETEMEGNQFESVSSPQTVEGISSNAQKEASKEKYPEMSCRRRRKQQKPQRCSSIEQVAPHGLAEFAHSTTEDSVADYVDATHTLRNQHIVDRYVESSEPQLVEAPQIEKDNFSQYSLQRKLQSIKTGFHFKLLHRPYYLKGAKGSFRSQPHQCADCGKKFALRDSLKKHISRKHTIKIHQCSFCGKQYRLADSLRKHIKRDHSGETHHCIKCDKYFTSKESLKQHWRIHTGEKPFVCVQCGTAFRYRHHLKQHIQMHSGIIESCEFCGKQYNRRDSLKKHIKEVHCKDDGGTEDANFDLQAEEKHHMASTGILDHMKNSQGEKGLNLIGTAKSRMYFCRKCHLYFTCRQTLLRHMQIRHRKVILVCPICNQQYHLRDSLRKHVKSAHRLKLKDNRNTRAELESRRCMQKSNIEVADVEPDCEKKDFNILQSLFPVGVQEDSALSTPQDALGVMHFSQMVKLPKCPHCGKCYRLRDSLRKHIKRSHPGAYKEINDTGNNQTAVALAGVLSCGVGSPNVQSDLSQKEAHTKKLESNEAQHGQLKADDSHSNSNVQLKVTTGNQQDLYTSPTKACPEIIHNKGSQITNENADGINLESSQSQLACRDIREENGSDINMKKHAIDSDDTNTEDLLERNSCNKYESNKQGQVESTNPTYGQYPVEDDNIALDHNIGQENKICVPNEELHEGEADKLQGLYSCTTCTFRFESQQELDIHILTHPTCPRCKKQYTLRDSLRKHIKRSHPVDYEEILARKKKSQRDNNFVFFGNNSADLLSEFSQQNDTSEPNVHLERSSDKLSEDQTAQEYDALTCVTCTLNFDSEQELEIHSQSHPTCPRCFKQYTLKDSLRKHIKRSHPADYWEMLARKKHKQRDSLFFLGKDSTDPDVEMSKDQTELVQVDPSEQEIHQRSVEKEGSREDQATQQPGVPTCITCTLSFGSQQELDVHIRSHPTCPHCGKQYTLRDSLRKHIMRSHPEAYFEMMAQKGKGAVTVTSSGLNSTNSSDGSQEGSGNRYWVYNQERSFQFNDGISSCTGYKETDEANDGNTCQEGIQTQAFVGCDQLNDSARSFACAACRATFNSELDLSKHVNNRPTCPYCYKQYCLRDSLRKHIRRTHGEEVEGGRPTQILLESSFTGNLPTCSACGQTFDDQMDLEEHEQSHPSCEYCGKRYALRQSLRKHIYRKHADIHKERGNTDEMNETGSLVLNESNESHNTDIESETCDMLAAGFSNKSERTAEDGQFVDCPIGDTAGGSQLCEEFNTSHDGEGVEPKSEQEEISSNETSLIASEMAVHNSFPCSACLLVFDDQEALDSHARSHSACQYCGKLYTLKDSLRKHIRRSHPTEYSAYGVRGVGCSQSMDIENDIQDDRLEGDHEQSAEPLADDCPGREMGESDAKNSENANEKDHCNDTAAGAAYPCTVCFLVFDSAEALESHASCHPTCPHCGKMYHLKDSLSKHIKRSHAIEDKGEKRCDSVPENTEENNCDNDTKSGTENLKDSENAGQNVSKPELPVNQLIDAVDIKQEQCEQDNIKNQENMTATGKFYPCAACLLVFDNQEALSCHAETHPGCPHCGKRYKLMDSLRKHIKRSHSMEQEKGRGSSFHVDEDSNNTLGASFVENPELRSEHSLVGMSPETPEVEQRRVSSQHASSAPVGVAFPCPACSVMFDSQEALEIHASNHPACPFCGRLYSRRNSLRKHIQRSHPKEYKKLKENSNFNNGSYVPGFDDLEEHAVSESANEFTDQIEPTEAGLSAEKSGHGEQNKVTKPGMSVPGNYSLAPPQCTICDLTFSSPWELKKHNQFLSCPHCDKHYSIRNSLKKHIQRSHPDAYWESRERSNSFFGKSNRSDSVFTANSIQIVAPQETTSNDIIQSVNSMKEEED